jgi:pseudouridine kinase
VNEAAEAEVTRVNGIICIGGATIDRKFKLFAPVHAGTSNPAAGEQGFGGVARNVAEGLARLGRPASLLSRVGDDANGRLVVRHLARVGADTSRVAVDRSHPTAEYVAVLEPDGRLVLGVADMAIFESFPADLLDRTDVAAAWIFADCNLPAGILADLARRGRSGSARVAVDAVSVAKAMRLPRDLRGIDLLFLNRDEARAYLGVGQDDDLAPSAMASALRGRGVARVVLTLEAEGLVAADAGGTLAVPAPPARIVDATGAGDALIASTLAGLASGLDLRAAARIGAEAAALTLESRASVRPDLDSHWFEKCMTEDHHG